MEPTTLPPWQHAPLLLASQSPRRRALLDDAGFVYRVVNPNVEEHYPSTLTPREVPVFLAALKNQAAAPFATEDEIILSADSIVVQGSTIFGKPADAREAKATLRQLQGQEHQVITGICLARGGKIWTGAAVTRVTLQAMRDDEIDWYIQTAKPFDKAGSYAIQEWIGLCKIAQIEGSYANVVGLPVHLLYQALQDQVV